MDGANNPLFILAPPSTWGAVVCAELGQHPQMYGFPELQLFGAETVAEWWEHCGRESFPMAHGLLRTVAQICFGRQTEETIQRARGWVFRRSNFTTGMIFEDLAERVSPRIPVDRSPGLVYRSELLNRALGMFPGARFLHLVQHPRSYCEWVMTSIRRSERAGAVPYWLLHLASFPDLSSRDGWVEHAVNELDPQQGWFVLHMNILEFLANVPQGQALRVSVGDWFAQGGKARAEVLEWLGLRTDAEALEATTHPERSPYAAFGPPGARFGNDPFFLEDPRNRPNSDYRGTLQGPLSWKSGSSGFLPEVVGLAEQFGCR